jgi:hypothetical protein
VFQVGWIAFSDLDFRHMLNCLLHYYGKLPDSELQTVHNLLMGKMTGRRSGEVNCVAASSWSLNFFHCTDGTCLCTMNCTLCFKKNNDIGHFPICFAKPKNECTKVILVVITLLLLEQKKMIKSALAIYDDKEDLVINSEIFETPDELVFKLKAVCEKNKRIRAMGKSCSSNWMMTRKTCFLTSFVPTCAFLTTEMERSLSIPCVIMGLLHPCTFL